MIEMNPLLLVISCCFVGVVWHIHVYGWTVSPALLAALQWLVVCASYYSLQDSLDRVSLLGAVVLVSGISAFYAGSVSGSKLTCGWGITKSVGISQKNLEWSIVLLALLGLVLMLTKALQNLPLTSTMSIFGGADSWYAQLRNILVAKPAAYGLAAYGLSFSFAASAYLVLAYRRGGSLLCAMLSVLVSFAYVLLSTGRTFMLLLACILIACCLPRERRNRLILMSLAPLGCFLLFVLVPMLGGRLSMDALLPMFKMYFLGPLAAYDWAINGGLPGTGGAMTFRTPLAVLRALGFEYQVPDLIQPWAQTKLTGNVYTVFTPYYRDFGAVGLAVVLGLLGLLHGWVYKQAMNGQALMIVVNAILFYALVMQFFQDQYFSLLSQWGQIVAWMVIFLWLRQLPEALPEENASGRLRI